MSRLERGKGTQKFPEALQHLTTYRRHRTEEQATHACLVDIQCPGASDSKETRRLSVDAEYLRSESIPCPGICVYVEVIIAERKRQIHSRSLDILLDRLSKVYGSEPRSPWILSAMNNARRVESECITNLIVQTQRIVHLQVRR